MTCMIDISSLSSQLLIVTVGSVQLVLSTQHVQTCSFCGSSIWPRAKYTPMLPV